MDDLNRQVSLLEGKVEDSERRAVDARRAAERYEQRYERAERAMRELEGQVLGAER